MKFTQGCGLCPVAVAIGHARLRTRVCILTCPVATVTRHKPFPLCKKPEQITSGRQTPEATLCL